jgi:predicted ATPase/transcriptional regulator with XRE-family HTH domain
VGEYGFGKVAMELLDSFGDWLRRRRTALRFTRGELAECVGCSVSALRKIEADERRPSRQLAELLANCLAIPVEEQPRFVEAARGARLVSQLGLPEPATVPQVQQGTPPWNLPSPTTSLVGREVELASLAQLLNDPGCRILTLVGPGGIGKTRLALEAASNARQYFPDGVFFVSLAATSVPEFMAPAITQALRINLSGPTDPHAQLINYLANKDLLLLLDNFEHLLVGVDRLVEMLGSAPKLKLLVTSRERLELQGEWVFEVQGLPVPPESWVEQPEEYSAVALFVQRARQARVTFELPARDRPHAVRICQLVEGMPLAIELAAGWLPLLSCQEIAAEIERGLGIMTTTRRDVPERQRSMLAVFDHSWNLLTEREQQALRQLSVFRGGFQREAAQAVAGASLPLLSALIAKSVVRRTAGGRYGLHELMRQYVAGQLAKVPAEAAEAGERHSLYYTDYMAGLEGALKGGQQLEALKAMDADIDNIRRAWRWAAGHGELAAVRKPMRALWYFYDIRGWFQEAATGFSQVAEALEQTLVEGEDAQPDVAVLHAYARAQQGWFCLRGGRFEESGRLLQASLDVLRAAGARVELVDALQHAGALDRLLGNFARSRSRFEEMLQNAEQTDDPWNAAIAEGNIGLAAQALGDYNEASVRMGNTVVSFRALGDKRMLGVALHFLGGTTCMLGEYDQAQTYLRESLALSRFIGDRWIEGMCLRELGNVARKLGADDEAAELFDESLAVARDTAETWSTMQALNGVGTVRLDIGDYAAARAAFAEQLAIGWEVHSLPDVLAALSGLAWWSVCQEPGQAASPDILVSVAAVLSNPAATERTKDDARRLWQRLEATFGSKEIEAARVAAENGPLETVVETALSTYALSNSAA